MAPRRGRFGYVPRAQPGIASELLSIARQQTAKEDQNIMDAWKNGGQFQGKNATDERVLAYWSKRMKDLDKDDPLYDSYHNQVLQLQYGVAQSKADLAHVQGKLSDGQYAQFFIKWAGKVPKNSEFWRVLQKDAAQLMESAKSKARANADKAKADAFNAFVKNTTDNDIAVGNALTDAITHLSKETGLEVTANGDRLLDLLTTDFKDHPGKYHALTDALKVGSPGFDGQFTHSFVAREIGTAEKGYDKIAVRANKDGYASAYASATKGQTDLSSWGTNLQVWDTAKSYDQAYNQMMRTWNDPNASMMDKQAAAATFSATVGNLAKSPGIDTASVTMLKADAARAIGEDGGDSPSFGTAMLGHTGITSDIASTVALQTQNQLAMDQNPGVYTYAPVDKNGNFDPTGKGITGIVPVASVPSNAVLIAQPGMSGAAHMVAVQPRTVSVLDPNDPKGTPVAIGTTLSYQSAGKTVTLYGYNDGSGNSHWSVDSPWASGVSGSQDKDGNLILTLPGTSDPVAKAAAIDAKYGTDISTQMKAVTAGGKASATVIQRDKDGHQTGRLDVSYDGSGFSVKQTSTSIDAEGHVTDGNSVTLPIGVNTPQGLQQQATAPSRWTAGDLPGITFNSPTAASVSATTGNLSGGQVQALMADPAFQHAFIQQTMQTLGTTDINDPRIVAGWRMATAAANTVAPGEVLPNGMTVSPTNVGSRSDLLYPGAASAENPLNKPIDITFNGQSLRLPGIPTNLGVPNQMLNPDVSPFGQTSGFAESVLAPGQLPGTPKPVVTPTSGPAAGPTAVSVTPTVPTTTPVTAVRPPTVNAPPSPTAAPIPSTKPPGHGQLEY